MEEGKLSKEYAQELMKIKGDCRGLDIKVDRQFVIQKAGKEALKKVQEKMEEVGFPLRQEEIKDMDFYPIGLDVLSMLAIKEVLNLDDRGIEEMGESAVKNSLFLKVFMRYFASWQLIMNEVAKIWHKHYTVGDLRLADVDEKEKRALLRMENFEVHPIFCIVLKGYFVKISSMIVNSPAICSEEKCFFKGDACHEFLIRW